MLVSSGRGKNGFDAYGGKILKKSHMDYWLDSDDITDPHGVAFELGEEIEKVESNFFELLPTISELWIINPNCEVKMNRTVKKLFKDNNVLIRGSYDTTAEQLAKDLHLRFLHLDVELASEGDYFEHGVDTITLCFYNNGGVYINQDCKCPGSSAGSIGGGVVDFDLPDDFYLTMKPEEIAGRCWRSDAIIKNGVLASFMEKAVEKQGVLLDYTEA